MSTDVVYFLRLLLDQSKHTYMYVYVSVCVCRDDDGIRRGSIGNLISIAGHYTIDSTFFFLYISTKDSILFLPIDNLRSNGVCRLT